MKVTGLLFSFCRVVCGERHAFFTIYIIAWNREYVTGMLHIGENGIVFALMIGWFAAVAGAGEDGGEGWHGGGLLNSVVAD